MTEKGQGARWRMAIERKELVLVAEHEKHGIVAMASAGAARDRDLGFDGEVYTLYVDPPYFGMGVGRILLNGTFAELRRRAFRSCVIWAHARNNARFFYEAM